MTEAAEAISARFLTESFRYGSSMFDKPEEKQDNHQAYLFGHPIKHSLSPLLHASLFGSAQLPWTFSLLESLDKADILNKLQLASCIGCAVTMPHKISFMQELDAVTEEGRMIGAVNTVFKRKDESGRIRYVGTNTDCIGIREAFMHYDPNMLHYSSGRPALVIGGGGTCRSAVYTLWKWMGASKIYIVGRLREEVQNVIASFEAIPEFTSTLLHVETIEQAQELESPALVLNAVPDLEPSTPSEILARDVTLTFLKNNVKGVVLEMCYHPHPATAFYRLAEGLGWGVISGVEAMIYQGIAQQVLWLEVPQDNLDFEHAARVIRKAVRPRALEQAASKL